MRTHIHLILSAAMFASRAAAAGLEWGPCPGDSLPGPDGAPEPAWSAAGGECNSRQAPLRWDAGFERTDGRRIALFTARYRSSADTVRGQLIVLDGGPGGSGIMFAPGASATLHRYRETGWDLYIPTHRGVGHSTALHCAAPPSASLGEDPAAYAECHNQLTDKWGADLDAFSTQDAARDVCDLVRSIRTPGQRTVLLGVSYGTFLAEHVVTACPAEIDAMVLDGLLPASTNFDRTPEIENALGMAVLDRCAKDPDCSRELPKPEETVADLFRQLERGTLCPPLGQFLDAPALRTVLGSAVGIDAAGPVIMTGLVRRLSRCNASDRQDLFHLGEQIGGEPGQPQPHVFSAALYRNVICATLQHRQSKTAAQLAELEAAGLFSLLITSSQAAACETWPKSRLEPLLRVGKVDMPVLMLQALFDVATPHANALETAAALNGPAQRMIEFPSGRHGLLLREHGEPVSCAGAIVEQFLDDPRREPDSSCTAALGALDFSGKSETVRQASLRIFGTPDVWGR